MDMADVVEVEATCDGRGEPLRRRLGSLGAARQILITLGSPVSTR
jgi:hypothetical protein